MAMRPLPTPEELRQLVRYEPETGKLFWRERAPGSVGPRKNRWGRDISAEASAAMWNGKHAGEEALCVRRKDGYLGGSVAGRQVLAHRIAWCLYYGTTPEGTIDHINGDRADNRITNLRDCPMSVNAKNLSLRKDNKFGSPGISYKYRPKSGNSWFAGIKVNGKSIYLGAFATIEQAISARRKAEKKYGFHEGSGKHGRGYYRR